MRILSSVGLVDGGGWFRVGYGISHGRLTIMEYRILPDPSLGNFNLGNLERALGEGETSAEVGPGGPQLCGDIDMRISRDGTWFYHGSPIGRKPLVKLFASVLHRDGDGKYWLETPAEKCGIQVDDAAFLAVEMETSDAAEKCVIKFRTNVGEFVTVDAEHPIRVETDMDTNEPSPYVWVRDGLEALIARAVFYDLVELGEEKVIDGETVFGVWSSGAFFPLGRLDEN